MATTTPNLKLTKPDYDEASDIAVINANMDLLDTAVAGKQNQLPAGSSGQLLLASGTAGTVTVKTDTVGGISQPIYLKAGVPTVGTALGAGAYRGVDTTVTKGSANLVTSGAVESALEEKQGTVTGAVTTILALDLTENRALISNASGKVAVSSATSTELGYLSGLTGNIQSQINKALAGTVDEIDTSSTTMGRTTKLISGLSKTTVTNDDGTTSDKIVVAYGTNLLSKAQLSPSTIMQMSDDEKDLMGVSYSGLIDSILPGYATSSDVKFVPSTAGTKGQVYTSSGSGNGTWTSDLSVSTVKATGDITSEGYVYGEDVQASDNLILYCKDTTYNALPSDYWPAQGIKLIGSDGTSLARSQVYQNTTVNQLWFFVHDKASSEAQFVLSSDGSIYAGGSRILKVGESLGQVGMDEYTVGTIYTNSSGASQLVVVRNRDNQNLLGYVRETSTSSWICVAQLWDNNNGNGVGTIPIIVPAGWQYIIRSNSNRDDDSTTRRRMTASFKGV